MSRRKAATVPAALRPKTSPPAPKPEPEEPDETVVHVAILIHHPKVYEAIKDRIVVVGPAIAPVRVHAHVILEDPAHRAHPIDLRVRMAMVELDLVDPGQVGFTFPEQTTLGWPERKDET